MRWFEDEDLGGRARRLRVATLTGLRDLGALGQAAAVIVAAFVLKLQIPVALCFVCIAASLALNFVVRARFGAGRRLDDDWATGLLAFDVTQLAALLGLTGGLLNPFAVLLLAPVMTAATALPAARAAALLALTLLVATAVALFSLPLPLPAGEGFEAPMLYRLGVWAAIALSAAFVTFYAYRVAEEARALASALAATELALAREQYLSQLDGVAAAAAHALATPLGTIALVAHELLAAQQAPPGFADDLRLLEDSVAQCRRILAKLSAPQDFGADTFSEAPISQLIEELAAPRRLLGVDIAVEAGGQPPEPIVARNPGALFGLGNIVENGVNHAERRVVIRADWNEEAVRLVISDDGPGFPPSVLARVGEPYISTPTARTAPAPTEREGGGLGLGLFIAITLLERAGATLAFANAEPPGRGASVTISWPRAALDAGRRPASTGLDKAHAKVGQDS